MRKIYTFLLFTFVLLVSKLTSAQTVSSYTFNQSTSVYTPITGGTLIGNTSSDDQYFVNSAIPLGGSVLTGSGFPIGFNFTYAGNIYDRVGVNNNGWISLGNSALTPSVDMTTSSAYVPIASTATNTPALLRARIAAVGKDLQAQAGAELRIQTIGTAPSRQCIIQWTNYKRFGTNGTGDNFNFQIILNETTNAVQVKFGSFVFGTSSTAAGVSQIGLGGTTSADFNDRNTALPYDWNTTVAGASNADGAQVKTTTVSVVPPASGLTFTWNVPAGCTGTPAGGATQSTTTSVCSPTASFTLSVTGATSSSGLTYQWQQSVDNSTWTDIAGATSLTYTATGATSNIYFRRKISCGANSSFSTSILITVNAAVYTTLPYTESFESAWVDACNTRDVPNNFWRNTPATGNNSWRRNDDGASGAWSSNAGAYTPAATDGQYSARFHSYDVSGRAKGQLDLYVNCNNASLSKSLSFDYINTSGTDSLTILISTNGGTSFQRLDSAFLAAAWRTKTLQFNSTSATTILRFEATGDFGTTDIGLDNITINNLPNCSGTPPGGSIQPGSISTCNATPFTLTISGSIDPLTVGGISFQWQQSIDGGITWTNIVSATSDSYTSAGATVTTQYRRQTICSGNTGLSSSATITVNTPTYSTLPFAESFENSWSSICDVNDVPNNNWRNNPVTGNASWRRNDDPATTNSALWTSPNLGAYTPDASVGNYSARFHTYFASAGAKGQLNLYVNCNNGTTGKRLSFDFINTTGSDSLVVYLSTNGGTSFTRLDSVRTSTIWKTKQIVFASTSATTVLRFEATSDFGGSDIGLDNIAIVGLPSCTGTPAGGTVSSTATLVCSSTPFTLNVAGAGSAATTYGITYQWQQSTDGGTTWNNITGATGDNYTSAGIVSTTQYRRKTICAGNEGISSAVNIILSAPAYAPLPFAESFEATWSSICGTNDAPNNFWRGSPVSSDSSWRRNDDGATANWTSNLGIYTPNASAGSYSARFHTYDAASGTRGQLNVYLNASTGVATKRLTFDFINTDGADSLSIYLSTNGGSTYTRLDSVQTSTFWRTKSIVFTSTSATTVIRFQATSDYGFTDIGLDNINIVDYPNCSGAPAGGITVSTSTNVCPSTPFTVSVTGATQANGITYQWQQSIDGGVTWTNIPAATSATYASGGITVTTQYRLQVLCGANSSTSTPVAISLNAPTYAALPYAESFEATWLNGCDQHDIPNNSWRNNPVTGNQSWRRNDDGASANWSSLNAAYTPDASAGSYSARFHSYDAPAGTKGQFNLYINAATASAAKRVSFDYINIDGSDSLTILLSTNGGATFVRLDSAQQSAVWRTKQVLFSSTSATTVIRFEATSDYLFSDIGIDNILITDFSPCAGAPNAGTAVSSSTSVCSEQFTLSLQGSSSAAGLTYQWQKSADNITWTDIAGATSISYTTGQTGTTYYRAIVKCGSESAYSAAVQVISPTLVSGTFAINNALPTNIPGATFNSFNDAYNYIKCGINGPVVFNVKDNLATTGVYNEQLIMLPVPGTSAANTVSFKGHGATISFTANNSNERAVIKLRGADYIRFDSLIINAFAGTYGYGVQLISNADSNMVSNCVINTNAVATSANYAGIVINGTEAGPVSTGTVLCDYNQFLNNTINGGYYGVTLVSSTTGRNTSNRFVGNKIQDFYQYGFYVSGSLSTVIDSNIIQRPTRTTVSDFYGVYFTGVSELASISKNRITNPFGGSLSSTNSFYGIYFINNDATSGNENSVSNNLIYKINGQGAEYGLYNSSSDNVYYLHNTVAFDSAGSTSSSVARGFYQTSQAGGIVLFNNMITITRGGTGAKHAIYMFTNTTGFIADYNNYYVNAPAGANNLGFFTSDRNDLAAWQSATSSLQGSGGGDVHSLSRNPFYALSTRDDYNPTNGAVDNKGYFAGIPTDIAGVPRSTTKPDIGAFEFTALPCTLPPDPGNTLFNDTTVCQVSPVRLNLTISSWGAAETFQWQTATSAAGPWTNLGGLHSDPDTTIISSTSLFYRAAVTCGGTTVFSNPLQLLVSPALPTGTYTINKLLPTNYTGVPGANFASFNDAKAAMGCGIIGGPVVFNVVAGGTAYNEQLRLDSIPGVSATNTITFNGNGNTIAFAGATTNERAVIKISAADHIIFDSLRIDASAGTTYGYGVQLINNADSNTFRRCSILSSGTATTTNYAGIVINAADANAVTNGGTFSDGNVFNSNTITGGYYGVTVVGGTTASAFINDNQFTNNTISEFYNYGFYISGTYNTLIERNLFTRPTRSTTASSVYGIYATAAASNKLSISKNRFTRFFTGIANNTASLYALYHNSIDATTGSETIVSNNLVYGNEGNASMYGFYNLGSDNVFYYHNTISFDNAASTPTGQTAGLYQTTAATGIFFKDNIVTIKRAGTGLKYGVYLATSATEFTASNNDYFIPASSGYIGFKNANQLTLAQWQAATGQEANSYNLNPLYADTLNGNYKPQITGLDNKGIGVGIATDIVNVTRSTTTPDIGAYEFAPIACQNPPTAGVSSVTPNSGICLETPIHLTITGNSPLGNITFQWQYSPDGTSNWTNISGVQYFPDFDTISTVNSYYRAVVSCDGSVAYTNTVHINLNPLLLSGVYTINPANPTGGANFNTFQDAVTAMLCGITGPVTFNVKAGTYSEKILVPYIRNTSPVNTVTFQSESGVASSVVLSAAGTSGANYTLRLDSTRYFTFRNMSFTATDATNGRAVELFNEASNDNFINNIINAPAVTTASTSVAGIYANAFKGKNITIKGNTVNNGSRGIHFTGTSTTVLANAGHVIDSNTVNNAYNYGIYAEFTQRLKLTNNTVSLNVPMAFNSAGIYANYADTAFRITGNSVAMNGNTATTSYGIYVFNSRGNKTDSSILAGNRFNSDSNNTGTVYGITVSASKSVNVVNNVVAVNNAGATAYGLYSLNNADDVNYYNNSVNLGTTAANGYAGYFNHSAAAKVSVNNNIFSNTGGGKALYVNNPVNFTADYNMLYTSGANLVQVATGAALNFTSLKDWISTWNWDRYSISYAPAFSSTTTLRPNLANPDAWAMQGRGTQIAGNAYDFDNKVRPTTLTSGVPDLGAYEFFPTAQPTVLTATPATPAPNTTQIFSYGTDTVMKITWGPTAPPTVAVRRFSGVVPSGLLPTQDSMFFYTKVDVGGTNTYNYAARLYYINPWQGSIPQQYKIGLGRTTPSNAWVVGQNSKVDIAKKEISQTAIVYLDRFTGLVNPFAVPESDDSSSNRGKDFWVGYQRTNGFSDGNVQNMVIYMGASDQAANVTITIQGNNGTPWVRTYQVPANTTVTSDFIPKTSPDDARLITAGLYTNKGIHITSDVPIVAYAHIYESTNSGATMLLPSTVWGYEYYTLQSRQYYTNVSYSAFHIVAQHDSTLVEINPSAPTQNGMVPNGGTQPNGSYLIRLNKGDAYQVLGNILSGSEGVDLSGSYIKSIGGATGCYPIAVFAGSTRTAIGCGTNTGGSGDLIIQQIFPYQAWGTKYLTGPITNSNGPNATSSMVSLFRVMVKDPTTVVKRNGVIIPVAQLIGNRYYQFETDQGEYIESNKPIMVAEYMSSNGACGNTGSDGDPEMFYLSPVEQAIKKTQFYRNNLSSITSNYITIVIPTEGLPSLRIDGVSYGAYPLGQVYTTSHIGSLAGYTIVTKKWTGVSGSSTIESDYPFTGIVYGEGSVESYGYNLGTLVKNLNNLSTVNTVLNSGNIATGYTCKGSQFRLTALLPLIPDSIRFQVSAVPRLTPNSDVVLRNPVPDSTVTVNGVSYFSFTLSVSYTLDSAGTFSVPIQYWSPEIESCDKKKAGALIVQVLPKPATNFSIAYPNGLTTAACQGDVVNLTGDLITSNGIALNQWQWTFAAGGSQATANGQNQTISYPNAGSYAVSLRGITADGCLSDTTRSIVINAKPVVTVVQDSVALCPGSNATFQISNPIAGAVYKWYSAATGGTLLGTGTTFTLTGATPPVSVWVEATSNSCTSVARKQVKATLLGPLTPANVRVLSKDVNSVTFTWDPVPLANPASYMVSVRGAAFIPANGLPNLTHTVINLRPVDTVSIRVMAVGNASCQTSTSPVVVGQTLPDQIYIPNSFSPNGDGLNDVLLVYGYVIKDMQFIVFNQWGEKIFESRAQNTGWDGTYKGKGQPSGVYMYVAKFTLKDGSTIERKGSINLVR